MYTKQSASGVLVPSLSPRVLLQCALVLMSLSGVVAKYRPILVTGLLQLFYMDCAGINAFLRQVNAKWPSTCPKKVVSWMQLMQDLLEQCQPLTCGGCREGAALLLRRFMKVATDSHVDCALQALSVLNSARVMSCFILPYPEQMKGIEKCLNLCSRHWSEGVREKAEIVFDVLLDYLGS